MVSRQVQNAINEAPADLKFMHAATYSGHAVCCAVGLANVAIIEREGLVDRAAKIGPWFIAQLRQQLEPLARVGQVRGLGMMAAVELVDPTASGTAFYDNAVGMAGKVVARCVDKGILERRLNNTICMALPLISTEAQLSRLVEVLAESIQAESVGVVPSQSPAARCASWRSGRARSISRSAKHTSVATSTICPAGAGPCRPSHGTMTGAWRTTSCARPAKHCRGSHLRATSRVLRRS